MLLSFPYLYVQDKRKNIEIRLISGRAIINPARIGFLTESQLAKAMINPEKSTFNAKESIEVLTEKVLIF